MNLTEVTDLTSIGTLFAFVLVCGGVLILDKTSPNVERKFRTPRLNSRYLAPIIFILIWGALIYFKPDEVKAIFNFYAPWSEIKENIPLLIFIPISFLVVVICMVKELSLIPVLGLMTCGYLMTQLGWTNWMRFLVWLTVGLFLFFSYGSRHSKLASEQPSGASG
jgi:amino acid transporter